MIHSDDAIVRPIKSARSPDLGPLAILVATAVDLKEIRRRLDLPEARGRHLFISRLWQKSRAAIVGPILGAPYAAMILETLCAWGAREFLFLGWCGSLVADVKIGEILLPDSAIVDEGTSGHYRDGSEPRVNRPPAALSRKIEDHCCERGVALRPVRMWSTDAVFRETPQKVRHFVALGAKAVDMETSALFTVAGVLRVEITALLVVSDTLAGMRWQPGFRSEDFAQGRTAIQEVAIRMALAAA